MRQRIAEISEYAVAHVFGDEAAVAFDEARAALVIGGNDLAHILGIEPCRERRRADKITKHDGQLPALGDVAWLQLDRSASRTWVMHPIGAVQTGDRLQQPFSVAHRHTELFEISVTEVWQDLGVDFALAKCRFVLAETEIPQPSPHVHGSPPSARWHSRAQHVVKRGVPGLRAVE
jgi:hypothetical protein